MVNATHLKVLLKKDYLTLIRNKGFLIAFVFVPVALMGAFIGIQTLVN
jgi:ABC-type Na+ efflux pump permease subunit